MSKADDEKPDRAEKASLIILLVVVALVVGVGGLGITYFLTGLTVDGIETGLTNVATVGGVASGLSLSGTTVLSLKGQLLQGILTDYNRFLRGTLFGGYSIMVSAAIACALFSAKPDHPAAMWVMAYSAMVTIAGLLLTAFMINGLFSKQNKPAVPAKTKSPVRQSTKRTSSTVGADNLES